MRIPLLILLFLPGFFLQNILLATRTGLDQVIVSKNGTVATKELVNFFTSHYNGRRSLEEMLYGASAVDILKGRDEIYFTSGRKVFLAQYDRLNGTLLNYTEYSSAHVLFTDLAIDWENNDLYLSSSAINAISVVHVVANTSIRAADTPSRKLSFMEFDPYTRTLFYIDENKRLIQHELGKTRIDDVMMRSRFPQEITEIFAIAVDVPKQTVYAIVTYMVGGRTNSWCLIRIDYKIFEYKKVFEGPELSNIVGLDAFSDEVVWASHHNLTYKLYKGCISLEGMLENVTVIYETTKRKIRGIKIDDIDSQKPTTYNLCAKVKCSHGCKKGRNMKYPMGIVCTCPEDLMLDSDGRTCTGTLLHSYLLATDTGIEELIVTDNGSTTSTVVNLTQGASAVYFHRAGNEIYFISGREMLRTSYYPPTKKPSGPTQVPTTCQYPIDLVFDWETGHIYYICANPSAMKTIYVFRGEELEKTQVLNSHNVTSFRIDPYARSIFVLLDSKRLLQFVIDNPVGVDVIIKSGFPYEITEMNKVAVDVPKHTLYLIVTYVDGGSTNHRHLIRIDYKTFHFQKVYTGPELFKVVSLDALNEEVVLINYHNHTYTLYSGSASSEGQLENLTVIYRTEQEIRDVKIYHRNAQQPSTLNLCLLVNCSHHCKRVNKNISANEAACTCPIDMLLDSDGRTCKGPPVPSPKLKLPSSGIGEEMGTPTQTGSSTILVLSLLCSVGLLALLVYYKMNHFVEFIHSLIFRQLP